MYENSRAPSSPITCVAVHRLSLCCISSRPHSNPSRPALLRLFVDIQSQVGGAGLQFPAYPAV